MDFVDEKRLLESLKEEIREEVEAGLLPEEDLLILDNISSIEEAEEILSQDPWR